MALTASQGNQPCIDPRGMSSPHSSETAPSIASFGDSAQDASTSTSSPPKKKRKSWGQVLPKPTTNLPPRKRAKTAEEKQQRHYERVQRNRQAAHNSRMRKQDEMERAMAENNRLRQDNQHLQDELSRVKEELRLLRNPSASPILNKVPSPILDCQDISIPRHSSTPSLTNDTSIDDESIVSNDFASLEPLPLPLLDEKPLNDTHSAVDVEQRGFFEGEGWYNDSGLLKTFEPLGGLKLEDVLNLDYISGPKDTTDDVWLNNEVMYESMTDDSADILNQACKDVFVDPVF